MVMEWIHDNCSKELLFWTYMYYNLKTFKLAKFMLQVYWSIWRAYWAYFIQERQSIQINNWSINTDYHRGLFQRIVTNPVVTINNFSELFKVLCSNSLRKIFPHRTICEIVIANCNLLCRSRNNQQVFG